MDSNSSANSQKNEHLASPIKGIHYQGRWSQIQNTQYYAFLRKFIDMFQSKEQRRQFKVFKALSKFVRTRDPNQCRGHHHKLKRDYDHPIDILKYLKNKYEGIEQRAQQYYQQLENIQIEDNQGILNKKYLQKKSIKQEQQNQQQIQENEQRQENKQNMKTKEFYASYPHLPDPYIPPQQIQLFNNFQDNNQPHLISPLNNRQPMIRQPFFGHGINMGQYPYFNYGMNSHSDKNIAQKAQECQQSFNKWWEKINEVISENPQGDKQKQFPKPYSKPF